MKAAVAIRTVSTSSGEKMSDSFSERRRRQSEAWEYRVYCAVGLCLFLPLVVSKRVLGALLGRADQRSVLTETSEEVQNILGVVFMA